MDTELQQEGTSPDPKQWRALTKAQRIDMVEHILLKHERFNILLARIDYCARFGSEIETKNPPCLAILGNTGAGKTTLVDTWLENALLRDTETPEGSIIPYLYVLVPSSPKKKGAVAAFLRALHDPNPSRGTEWDMISRVHRLIKRCKVQMIFVDEFQHLIDKDTQKVVHAIADFLVVTLDRSGTIPVRRTNHDSNIIPSHMPQPCLRAAARHSQWQQQRTTAL